MASQAAASPSSVKGQAPQEQRVAGNALVVPIALLVTLLANGVVEVQVAPAAALVLFSVARASMMLSRVMHSETTIFLITTSFAVEQE